MFLQGFQEGSLINELARGSVSKLENILVLLDARQFASDEERRHNYFIAGSFCDFLLRRFGFKTFSRLYKGATRHNFAGCFHQVIGKETWEVERAWREELSNEGSLPK